jgi:hypothetical protein
MVQPQSAPPNPCKDKQFTICGGGGATGAPTGRDPQALDVSADRAQERLQTQMPPFNLIRSIYLPSADTGDGTGNEQQLYTSATRTRTRTCFQLCISTQTQCHIEHTENPGAGVQHAKQEESRLGTPPLY